MDSTFRAAAITYCGLMGLASLCIGFAALALLIRRKVK